MPQKVSIGRSSDDNPKTTANAKSSAQTGGVKRSMNPKIAIGVFSGVVLLAVFLIAWSQGLFGDRSSVSPTASTANTVSTPFSDDKPMGDKRNGSMGPTDGVRRHSDSDDDGNSA